MGKIVIAVQKGEKGTVVTKVELSEKEWRKITMAASELLKEMGERLRTQRKKMGLTQEKAAELLEMSTTFYGEVERGNRRLSLEKIVLAADRLGLEPGYLILGKVLSNVNLSEILKDCPKEKEAVMEQIVRYLALLYR